MPDWTRGQLRDEWVNHGFHFIEGARRNGFIQRAAEMVYAEDDWPHQLRSETLSAGVALGGLGRVVSLLDSSGNPLKPVEHSELEDDFGGASADGSPAYYYREGSGVVQVWPGGSGTFTVRHYSTYLWVNPDATMTLEAKSDDSVPTVPGEFRQILVEAARILARRDTQDDDAADQIQQGAYAELLDRMRGKLKRQQVNRPRRIRIVSGVDWA